MSWTEQTRWQILFIIKTLKLTGNERILDLACGYGRHSIALAKKGFSVSKKKLVQEIKRSINMKDFPEFMKSEKNKIPQCKQNTKDIEGYYFGSEDGSQAAYWTCHSDQVSKEHVNDFDEYMVCVYGEYTVYIEGNAFILKPGDELYIPKGKVQWGKCIAGTRTIHVFGGKRI